MIYAIIILAQLVFIAWYIHKDHSKNKELIKAILSKDVHDFVAATKDDKKPVKEKEPDLVPVSSLSDKQFNKLIKKQVNG